MAKLSTLRCVECGSRELTADENGGYRCSYCGTTSYPSSADRKQAATPRGAGGTAGGKRAVLVALAALGVLAVVGTVLGLLLISGSDRGTPPAARSAAVPLPDRSPSSAGAGAPAKPEALAEYGAGAVEKAPEAKAELRLLTPRPDSIGNTYFVGVYRNTGEAVIERPRAEVRLFDKGGEKVAVGTGYAARDRLPPGEETPIKIMVRNTPAYDKLEVHLDPQPPSYPRTRPKMAFEGVKVAPGRYRGYRLTGKVKNTSQVAARFVQIIVLALGDDKRPMGVTSSFLQQKVLPPGDSAPFDFTLHQVDEAPASVRLDYDATPVER